MNQKPTKQKLYAAVGARRVPIVVSYGLSQIAHVNPIIYEDRVAVLGREQRELSHLWDSVVSASFPQNLGSRLAENERVSKKNAEHGRKAVFCYVR